MKWREKNTMSKASFLPQSSKYINLYARGRLEIFLKKVKKMIKEQAKLYLQLDEKQIKTITQPQVFLSYAWEVKTLKNEALQSLLKAMKKDFESAGMRPWFDLAQMTGEMDEKMLLGIQGSQYVLLIGTNRYAARTEPGSNTNVYKELQFILKEYKDRSSDPERADFILPLMLEGDYQATFPALGHHLIRDGRSWYNLEQNDWQSIDDYIKRLTEYEPVGILPCLLGLSRRNDYPAYRKACLEKYKDYRDLLMLELNLDRGKIEKQEFEQQKQELQIKEAELTLSLKKWQAERSFFEKESEQLLIKLKSATSSEERLSKELFELQSNSSSNQVQLNQVEKKLEQERTKSNQLRIQHELAQQLMQPKLDLFREQEAELDFIQAQLNSQQKKLSEREQAVAALEDSLKEHQEKLDKQAAEQENMEFLIKAQLTEIKKYSETPGELKLVSKSPIQQKSSISPWSEAKFDSEGVGSPQTMLPVSPNNLNQLLQFVAEGEQEKAEILILKDQGLLLLSGEVKDLSGREFKQITAFQYALWAVDWHMWTMIQKYLSKENQEIQLRELEIRSTAYGKHFKLTGLTNALQFYVDYTHRAHWFLNRPAETFWSQGVGQEQKLLPAHLVNEYCRLDRAFNPCPKEWTSPLPRTRKTESMSWFIPFALGVELGSAYAFYRDNTEKVVHRQDPEWPYTEDCINPGEPALATKSVIADLKALQSLWKVRTQQLKLFKSQFLSTPMQSALQDQLVTACKEGDEKQVGMLLEKGALPDMPNAEGEQPLGAAVWGMCPNIINALLTRVDGVAPMTWRQCEAHNSICYKGVFVGTYGPLYYRVEWYKLLQKIESNKFMKSIHLEGACKHYQEQYSWENLKLKCARLSQPYDAKKKDEEFWEKTEQEFENFRKQIKQTIEKPPIPKISRLEQPGSDSKHTTKSMLQLPPLAETSSQHFMPSPSLPKTGSAPPAGNDTVTSLNQNY